MLFVSLDSDAIQEKYCPIYHGKDERKDNVAIIQQLLLDDGFIHAVLLDKAPS